MAQNQRGFSLIRAGMATIVIVVIIGIGWTIVYKHSVPRCEVGTTVALGQEFTVGKDCFVKIGDTDLEVGITGFYNHPCPKDGECIWSGLSVDLEYRVNGEVKKDINLVRDYGYQTRILKSDYETYASLKVEKSESYYVQ